MIESDECVVVGGQPVVALSAAPLAETAGRVTVGYIRADMDYQAGAAEALYPDMAEPSTTQSSVPSFCPSPRRGDRSSVA